MKRSYKIGEVCKQLDIQPYVLRYWETEFPALHPQKSQSGQRAYSEGEIDTIRRIKRLLYDEGYTIAGAKKKLEGEPLVADGLAAAPLFAETPAVEATAVEEEVAALDSPAEERIESLQRGVAEALEEARAILILLEPKRR
jgi:DNA-binding transcriptional MerR regulator